MAKRLRIFRVSPRFRMWFVRITGLVILSTILLGLGLAWYSALRGG